MLVRRGRQFAIGVSAFAGIVSTAVLLGWMLDSALLVSVIRGAAKMMPNTAIGFILVAYALWYRSVAVAGTTTREALAHDSGGRLRGSGSVSWSGNTRGIPGAALIWASTSFSFASGWWRWRKLCGPDGA